MILTILLFFIYSWGLGFSSIFFLKNSDNFLERNLMRIGLGLGIIPLLIAIFSLLRIPIDWRIFLVLSLLFPVIYLFKNIRKLTFKLKLTKTNLYILAVLLLFAFTFFMYHKGAFLYPYLEDDDPWSHASDVKYVATYKTVLEPIPGKNLLRYIDAYPPGYDGLMGILAQTSRSLQWTLKFFNALIISFGIIFFYFFVKEFTQDKGKALFSTCVLAMIPSYLSHFIWSHAYIITLIFPLFYALEMSRYDKRWLFLFSMLLSTLWLIEITDAIKITVLVLIYYIIKVIYEKRFLAVGLAIGGGLLLSFLLWWLPMVLKYGKDLLSIGLGETAEGYGVAIAGKSYIGRMGSATRLYTFNDFFYTKFQNMINNPVGIGIVISLLTMFSIVYLFVKYKDLRSKENSWKLITFLWLLFTFSGLYGGTVFPIALWSFRFWMLLAIPVSIIVSEGVWFLFNIGKKIKINYLIILIILIPGIWLTSGHQKYVVNIANWPPGGWLGPVKGELEGFLWLKSLPKDTKIFVFSDITKTFIFGFDKYSCEWCPEVINFREGIENRTAVEIHKWLKDNSYEYVIYDYYFVNKIGTNKSNELLKEIQASNLFELAYQTESVIILKPR